MNLTFWIASRLNLKPQGNKRRSPGVTIAVAGVAISIAVMIMAVAVVMGFKNSIKQKLTGLESAITITAAEQNPETSNTFVPSEKLLADIGNALPQGAGISTTLTATSLLKTDDDYLGISLRAYSPGSMEEDYIRRNIVAGEFPDYTSEDSRNVIVISATTASLLGLEPGNKVRLHFFADNAVRTRPVRIAAIYDTSFAEIDRFLAIASAGMIVSAQKIPENSVSSINISGEIPESEIDHLAQTVQQILLDALYEQDTDVFLIPKAIRQRAAVYFNWLDLLDTNVIVIIILMSLVAAFTLISSLLILILERISFIGILKSMGATTAAIQRIFIVIALRIVLLGLLIGNIFAIGLLTIQKIYHIIPLDPQAYFLDSVPVDMIPWQIVLLNIAAVAVSAAVLIVPTTIISTISPASTIKYE